MELTIVFEILKGIGRFFLNPIVYWTVVLLIMTSHDRIKKERYMFLFETAPLATESRKTISLAIIGSILLAAITLGAGIALTYEIIIILMAITLILSITYRLSTLSASYTLGLTYVVLQFLPESSKMIEHITPLTMSAIPLLIGILLLYEGILFLRLKGNDFFPTLVRSRRGKWYGLQHLKRLAIIPMITLVPKGALTPFGDLWPYFTIAEQSYSLIVFPVLIGFHHVVTGELPQIAARRFGQLITSLAILVIVFALISINLPGLSLIAASIAILGRFLIHWQYYRKDVKRPPIFLEGDGSLKILGVIDDAPANKLGFVTGETIQQVNGRPVQSADELDYLLKENNGLVTFEVVGVDKKLRQIKNDSYQGDRYDLGLLLTTKPYSLKTSSSIKQASDRETPRRYQA